MSSADAPLSLFAATAPGLEALCAGELRALGVRAAPTQGGVGWRGTREQLYLANLHLRTASRVLVRLAQFRARTFWELERHAARIEWERYVDAGQPVELRVTCRKSRLYHQGAVAQRVYEAIEKRAGAVPADRPAGGADEDDEGEGEAAQLFVVRFVRDRCTLSIDSSGALLHRRGYREALARAPLRETLAAALLQASGWRADAPLLDPMCGAGTVAIEAALAARRVAPGLARAAGGAFALQRWAEHDAALWDRLVEQAREQTLPRVPAPIHASDRDAGAIEAATANARRAGVLDDLLLEQRAVSDLHPPDPAAGPGWLVSNPPYGVRVGDTRGLRNLYAALGRTARERLPGWTVALLSADRRLEAQLGFELQERLETNNGGIPVRVVAGLRPAGDRREEGHLTAGE